PRRGPPVLDGRAPVPRGRTPEPPRGAPRPRRSLRGCSPANYTRRMNSRSVGRTGIRVSEIGFGCWTMGGPNWDPQTGQQIGWADVDEDDVLAGIRAGLDAGVNHFDNADVYGNGRAERLLRDCLDRLGLLRGAGRDGLVIATKVGH